MNLRAAPVFKTIGFQLKLCWLVPLRIEMLLKELVLPSEAIPHSLKGRGSCIVNESRVTDYLFGEQMTSHAVPLCQAESLSAESINKANLKRLTKAELNEMANSYLCSYEFHCLVRRELERRKTKVKAS